MRNRALIMMALLAALPVSAHHVQPLPSGPGNGAWLGAEDQRILCESNGWWDSIHPDPIPHPGVGGNCYYWLTSVAPGQAGDASLPAVTCTQNTLLGAILALELTPGCQTYQINVKPSKRWWCLDNTLTAQFLPLIPGVGGKVPTTWRVGSFQMQGDSKGMCFEELHAWWEGSHIAAFPTIAWSEPFPGVIGFGNIPGAEGVIGVTLGPVINSALPVWCTAGGHHPKFVIFDQRPAPMCVDESTVFQSLYI